MIGCGVSLGRADRLGQPRLSEGAQPYPAAAGWPVVGAWLRRALRRRKDDKFPEPEPEPDYPHLAPDGRDLRPENPYPQPIIRSPYLDGSSQPPTAYRLPPTAYLTIFFHPSIVSFSNSLGSILMP